MATQQAPGVYRRDEFITPAPGLRTGAPAFLGAVRAGEQPAGALETPHTVTLWSQFEGLAGLGLLHGDGYLARAVRGFFENGGALCQVLFVPLGAGSAGDALRRGLELVAASDLVDLVCAPDIMRPAQAGGALDAGEVAAMQAAVLEHCDRLGNRFAILDALPNATVDGVLAQRSGLHGASGALYYPWITVLDAPSAARVAVPPCGHVAGIYSRSDARTGVHKAPANEVVEGALDLGAALGNEDQARLNPEGVNCLRAFPGRGIRVWGARTLSREPAWTYVNVRRLFITVARWVDFALAGVAFEPNDARLWARITRELTVYLTGLHRLGALKGAASQEAFYIRCNAETNSAAVRDAGMVVAEIGLAPASPGEFIVVRIIHRPSGVTITGPATG